MTTVRILPELLSNQIAAGEVVQRPASVVKELVENSIDANAESIIIEVEKGGKSLIRVSDNGIGLLRDDALLSIERYATSKIFSKQDLFSISTMGFRGEALPSIASVSKLTMVTRTKASDVGTRIDMAGGKIQNVSDAGAPIGTMVEVRHLFFNTPARKKFLRSDSTETGHIGDVISGIALGNPHIQFKLFLNNSLQKNFSLSDDLFQRSVSILGRDVADNLYKLEFSDTFVRIHGYCSNPSVTRGTSSKIFLFVNHRLVYDRGLISAIFQGYKGRIMKGRFPLGVFFIDIAFDQVDVNVHPSKREIKFFNGQKVYQAMSEAVGNALFSAQKNITAYSKARDMEERTSKKTLDRFEFLDKTASSGQMDQMKQSDLNWQVDPDENKNSPVQGQICETYSPKPYDHLMDMKIIGQALGTYILVETRDGIQMIDQHAAHERIVYEKLKRRYQTLAVQTQDLILPEILELNFAEADLLANMLEDLKSLGILIEPFGNATFVIKSVPAIIDGKEIKPVIMDMLESNLIKKDTASKKDWLDQCLILMACHGAIRANLSLAPAQMEKLLLDLEGCENPCHCPHGRPIRVTWTRGQIEKLFKRLV